MPSLEVVPQKPFVREKREGKRRGTSSRGKK
jgi:hypothetical protein